MPGNVIAVRIDRAACTTCGGQMYISSTAAINGNYHLWLRCMAENCMGHLSLAVTEHEFGRVQSIMDVNFPR